MQPIKQRVSVTIDSELLEEIDRYAAQQARTGRSRSAPTVNRSAVFEEALKLWRQRQIDEQIRSFYQNRSQEEIAEEEWWGELGAEQLAEVWSDF